MLTFGIDDLIGSGFGRGREAASLSDSSTESSISSPVSQDETIASDVSVSRDTVSIAQILLSLDKKADKVSPPPAVDYATSSSNQQSQNTRQRDTPFHSVLPSQKGGEKAMPPTSHNLGVFAAVKPSNYVQPSVKVSQNASPSTSPDNCSRGAAEKPDHSYIALISMAILQSPEKKLVLADIYQYIMDNFSYYNNKEKAWRNSVRHNLSLNECFVKSGRADNGKGNYWSIHPSCVEDFTKGDFRRRQARRRTRKTMKEVNMACYSPVRYGCDFGYVPMTSSPLSYHPYLSRSPCMMWSPPPIPPTQCYYLGGASHPQNFPQQNFFQQSLPQHKYPMTNFAESPCSPVPTSGLYPRQSPDSFIPAS